jgi:hypothetical protein
VLNFYLEHDDSFDPFVEANVWSTGEASPHANFHPWNCLCLLVPQRENAGLAAQALPPKTYPKTHKTGETG